jgi:hypothetical protein
MWGISPETGMSFMIVVIVLLGILKILFKMFCDEVTYNKARDEKFYEMIVKHSEERMEQTQINREILDIIKEQRCQYPSGGQ